MTRSKNSSGSHRKINREEKPEPRPPYALCFYQSEKATGVVESSCVPDNAKLHATILVPEAISCRSEVPVNPLKRFKATLIKFGHSINFLDEIIVDTDGNIFDPTKIDTNCKQTHKRSASKRKLSKDDEAEKAKQLKLLDESVSSLPTLYSAGQAHSSGPSSVVPDNSSSMTSTSPPLINDNELPPQDQESNTNVNKENVPTAIHGPNEQTHPGSITMSPLNQCSSINNFTPLHGVRLSIPMQVPAPVAPTRAFHQQPQSQSSAAHRARAQMPFLECYKSHPDKMLLVETQVGVYVYKSDWINIPTVVPRMKDTPRSQKKPKEGSVGAVFPSELVRRLVMILLPDDITMTLTGTTIPYPIYMAIKDFTNNRLGIKGKLDDTQITAYITDYSKTLKRRVKRDT